jgi:DHA3 family tetracycline resistance protein-like MFS transporter
MLGILLGVALAAIRVNVPILVGGGLFIALGIFLIFTMPETGFRPTPDTERNTWQQMAHTFRTGLGMVQRRPMLITILAIGLVYGLRKVDTTGDRGLAKSQLILAGLLIASLIAFSLSGTFALALAAFWAIAVLRTVIEPLYTTWVNQRIDSNVRATVLSMSSQVDAIGQVAGGPAVGWIGSAVSVRAAILTSSLILSPVLLLYGRAIRSSDRLREKNEPGGAPETPLDPS